MALPKVKAARGLKDNPKAYLVDTPVGAKPRQKSTKVLCLRYHPLKKLGKRQKNKRPRRKQK